MDNDAMIAVNGSGRITSLRYRFDLSREEALRMAAYIVALADPLGDDFQKVLDAVLDA